MLKLDYSLETPEERNKLVADIIESMDEDDLNPGYLDVLADYLILCMEKQEKKEKKILTENRMATVNKREVSYEGLVSQFENGEDGVYNLISENNKTAIFQPKVSITKKDLEEIPFLRQLREAIDVWEEKMKTATGRDAYIIKHTLIDLRKDQYIIKNAYRKPIIMTKSLKSKNFIPLDGELYIDENGDVCSKGITLADPKVCSAILCNYSQLKQDSWGNFEADTYYVIEEFERICDMALEPYPLYMRIVEYKIDGMQNIDIQEAIQQEFGIKHSVEYISSLWRNKIPKLIAEAAIDDFLNWHYLQEEKGTYKKCSRCGQIKLAHNRYFSKNKTSKDGFYSICKACRNAKSKKNASGQNLLTEHITF